MSTFNIGTVTERLVNQRLQELSSRTGTPLFVWLIAAKRLSLSGIAHPSNKKLLKTALAVAIERGL